MTRTTLPRLAASAAIVAALAFGACGGSDDAKTDTPKASAGGATTAKPAADAGSEAASGDSVDIVDFNYKPGNLKVKVGTKVTFTNKDGFAHTVTAKDKSFDSGNLDKDATFEQTFDKAGTFDYFCAIHNSMTGIITVA